MPRKSYTCPICEDFKYAEDFIECINEVYGLREMRILCRNCSAIFNNWERNIKITFLRKRIRHHYGTEQFIYALFDPRLDQIKYIGKTNNPTLRFRRHIDSLKELTRNICGLTNIPKIDCSCDIHSRRNTTNSSKYWIANLLKNNLRPRLEILEKVEPSVFVAEREMRWISHYLQNGNNLLNLEHQSAELIQLTSSFDGNFLEAPIKELISLQIIRNYHDLLSRQGRYSGWYHAIFVTNVFKSDSAFNPNIHV